MLGDLPKLFDRDFAIGYFLPVASFLGSIYGLLTLFHHKDFLDPLTKANILIGTTTLALITWLMGVFLLVFNRQIYQLFSGHRWPRWIRKIQIYRFRKAFDRLYDLGAKEEKCKAAGQDTERLIRDRAEIQVYLMECFPQAEHLVCATEFGNVVSAAVQYPTVMYGVNAIEGWSRLLSVIPKDYRSFIDSEKAQTDFWLNLCFLSAVILIIYFILVSHASYSTGFWFPFLNLLILWMAYRGAVTAVKEWGVFFKASFDIFLPELYARLHFSSLPDSDSQWNTWDTFSKAIVFRDRSSLPPRSQRSENSKEKEPEEEHKSESGAEEESNDADKEAADNNADDSTTETNQEIDIVEASSKEDA